MTIDLWCARIFAAFFISVGAIQSNNYFVLCGLIAFCTSVLLKHMRDGAKP